MCDVFIYHWDTLMVISKVLCLVFARHYLRDDVKIEKVLDFPKLALTPQPKLIISSWHFCNFPQLLKRMEIKKKLFSLMTASLAEASFIYQAFTYIFCHRQSLIAGYQLSIKKFTILHSFASHWLSFHTELCAFKNVTVLNYLIETFLREEVI